MRMRIRVFRLQIVVFERRFAQQLLPLVYDELPEGGANCTIIGRPFVLAG